MKRILTILLLILLSWSTYGQKNLQSGYIITSDGKKISGHINYKEWDKNPVAIEFSASGNEKDLQNFGLNDISYFEITGAEIYERHTCNISLSKVNLNELSIGADSSVKRETVFLKVLEKGRVNLYRYFDDLKRRYYIKNTGESEPRELLNSLYYDMVKNGDLVEEKEYQDQLRAETERFADNDKVKKRIQVANYHENDLQKLVRLINSGGATDKASGATVRRALFFAGAGLHYSSFSFTGNRGPYPTGGYSFSESVSPVVFGGGNLYLNPRTARLLLKTDLSFFTSSHKATAPSPVSNSPYQYTYNYTLKYSSLSYYAGATYNIIRTQQLEAYLGIGPALQFVNVSKNKEHESRVSVFNPADKSERDIDPTEIVQFLVTYNLRSGILLNRKLDVSLSFSGQRGKLTNYSFFKDKSMLAQLRIGYMFRAKKTD